MPEGLIVGREYRNRRTGERVRWDGKRMVPVQATTAEESGPSWIDTGVGMGLRVVPAVAGAILGVGGGPPGVAAGGALGAAGGEAAAELYEIARGHRQQFNPLQIGVQGALGAIPVPKVGGIGAGLIKGAGLGAVASGASEWAETGDVSLGTLGVGAGLGGALGAGGAALARRFAPTRIPAEPPPTPTPPAGPGGLAGLQGITEVVQQETVPPRRPVYDMTFEGIQPKEPHPLETATLRGWGRVLQGERPDTLNVKAVETPRGFTTYGPLRTVTADPLAAQQYPPLDLKANPATVDVPTPPGQALMRVQPEAPRPTAKPLRLVPGVARGERKLLQEAEPWDVEAAEAAARAAPDPDFQAAQEAFWPARGLTPQQGRALLTTQQQLEAGVQADARVVKEFFPAKKGRPTGATFRQAIADILEGRPSKFKDSILARAAQVGAVADEEQQTWNRILAMPLRQAEAEAGQVKPAVFRPGIENETGLQRAWRRFTSEGKQARDAFIRALERDQQMDRESALAVAKQTPVRDLMEYLARENASARGKIGVDPFEQVKASGMTADEFAAYHRVRGIARPQVLGAVAGGLGGAAYGGTQGETPGERAGNALIYATLGASLGYGGVRMAGEWAQGRPQPAGAKPVLPKTPETQIQWSESPEGKKVVVGAKLPGAVGVELPEAKPLRPDRFQTVQRAGGPEVRDRWININVKELPDEDRRIIEEGFERSNYYEKIRDGERSWARTEALASRLSINLMKVAGRDASDVSLAAYQNVFKVLSGRLLEIADRVKAKGTADAQDVLDRQSTEALIQIALGNISKNRSTLGRGLNYAKVLRRIEATRDPIRWLNQLPADARAELVADANKLAELRDNPEALLKYLMQNRIRTFADFLSDYQVTNLLSGWKTQERNFFGNLMKMPFDFGARQARALYERTRGVPDIQRTHVYDPEGAAHVFAAMRPAWTSALKVLREGLSETQEAAFREGNLMENAIPTEFAGGGRNPFNWVRRVMYAGDIFARRVTEDVETRWATMAYLHREGAKAGLKGDALRGYVSSRLPEYLSHDKELPKEVQAQLDEVIRRSSYQEKTSPASIVTHLKAWKARQTNPVVRTGANMVIPFLSTPYNIIRQGLEYSPAGFAYSTLYKSKLVERHGERLANELQMRGALGTALFAPMAMWAWAGNISGSGPKDRAAREQLMATGWRPNSIRLPSWEGFRASWERANGPVELLENVASPDTSGGVWVNYSLIQPLAVPMSMIANAFDAWRESGKDPTPPGSLDLAARVGIRAVESLKQQSFFEGLQNIFEAFENPDGLASGLVRNAIMMNVPASGFLRNVTQAVDPTVRYPRSLNESVRAAIPGLSQTVRPKLDIFGQDIRRDAGGPVPIPGLTFPTGVPEVSPVVQGDPVLEALQRTDVLVRDAQGPAYLDTRGVRTPLTSEQSLAAGRQRGQLLRRVLDQVVASPGFSTLPLARQATVLEDVKRRVNRRVMGLTRVTLLRDHPQELLGQLVAARSTERP